VRKNKVDGSIEERSKAMDTGLLTIQQVMEKLQVSDETIYRYIRSDKLKAVRVGGLWRVSQEALADFINKVPDKEDPNRIK
jgi:excisionase family DNA binding protein